MELIPTSFSIVGYAIDIVVLYVSKPNSTLQDVE